MNIIYVLIPLSLALGIGFTFAFIWATKKGQFDDLDTPAHRMLLDPEKEQKSFQEEQKSFQEGQQKDG